MRTRPGTMDEGILWEMQQDPYRARNRIKNGDIVVDAGANIGAFAKFVLSFAPRARLVCIEPMPANAELCRENLSDEASCVVLSAALMGEPGAVVLYDFGEDASACHSVMNLGVASAKQVTVPAITLGEVMQRQQLAKIDFLKLDVQGAEFDIIPKCPAHILDRVKFISMEVHAGISKSGEVIGQVPDAQRRTVELARHLSRTHLILGGWPGENSLLLWKNKRQASYRERIRSLPRLLYHSVLVRPRRILGRIKRAATRSISESIRY